MSYVGQTFDYDVFVSYSHALKETEAPEMQEWSRNLARRLRASLATALNTNEEPNRYFQLFIDEKGLTSGDLLADALEPAVRKSALLLVIMHPLYCKKVWCLRELRWFLDQANRDGRSVKYCQIVVAQPTEPTLWPKELVDESGTPALYQDFSAPGEGIPFGFFDRNDKRLLDLIPQVHMEVLQKLKDFRRKLEDRVKYDAVNPQSFVDRPFIFLHADQNDKDSWKRRRDELEQEVAYVVPSEMRNDLLKEERDKRLNLIQEANGLALLRTPGTDPDETPIIVAYNDRKRLHELRRIKIPWAIVDEASGPPSPMTQKLNIPRVLTETADWPARLLKALELNPQATAGKASP